MSAVPEGYTVCRYCRMPHPPAGPSCPSCGAALDIRQVVTRSGWIEQPPIKDLARIQFGQSRVQIEGKYVPVADFTLMGPEWIYFAHHALLWTEPGIQLGNTSLSGGWNRMLSGLPLIMVEARGPGRVALSGDRPGELIALPLMPGRTMWTREHRFLTATGNVTYTWQPTGVWYDTGSGDDRETHYPLGQFGDLFSAQQSPGLLLLHSPGNTFLRDLAPGETILVQPGALLYRDVSVQMHLHLEYPRGAGTVSWRSSFSQRNVWLRLIGPGRVAVSSVFHHTSAERITRNSGATVQRW
ncbi:AIM24 family protein [Dactylosporangium vinaceum]|uniref:AIM24 family protein n=1 Tax=Dactylosporangium vinaceum TaxID=53362 RepID=A0ABV5MLA6_9ACTN|nr:AIM24 family protein [Dactylosporangium vinaceum]UAB94100.1 AIM24 family protein [Dactylosporangium vinaceum]